MLREIGDHKFNEFADMPLFLLFAEAGVNPKYVAEYNLPREYHRVLHPPGVHQTGAVRQERGMQRYILIRFLQSLLALLVMSIIVFSLARYDRATRWMCCCPWKRAKGSAERVAKPLGTGSTAL